MTAFTDNLTATALNLLTTYGEAVSIERVVEGAYNVATGTTAAGTTTTYTGFGAPLDYRKTDIDGESIKQGDIRLILNKTSSVPAVGDVCTINSVAYRVMDVDNTRASGVNIIYTLQLRI